MLSFVHRPAGAQVGRSRLRGPPADEKKKKKPAFDGTLSGVHAAARRLLSVDCFEGKRIGDFRNRAGPPTLVVTGDRHQIRSPSATAADLRSIPLCQGPAKHTYHIRWRLEAVFASVSRSRSYPG